MKKRSGGRASQQQSEWKGPVFWRRLGTVAVIALPILFFLPGIGFDASHPASLARQSAPESTWYYRVRKGDVLTKIAERELGTLRRTPEIVALNPDVKPRALKPGSVLEMPARRKAATAVAPTPRTTPTPAAGGRPAPQSPGPTSASPQRLLLGFAGLLGLVVLVVATASHLERRAARA